MVSALWTLLDWLQASNQPSALHWQLSSLLASWRLTRKSLLHRGPHTLTGSHVVLNKVEATCWLINKLINFSRMIKMTYFITHLYLIEQHTELLSRPSRQIQAGRVLHAEHNNCKTHTGQKRGLGLDSTVRPSGTPGPCTAWWDSSLMVILVPQWCTGLADIVDLSQLCLYHFIYHQYLPIIKN